MTVSFDHEALVELFRQQPLLAAELLASVAGLNLHATAAELLPADLTDVVPAERRADLVIKVVGGDEPVAIINEVQLQPDPDKPWRWPHYVTSIRDRMRCRVLLLVLTLDEATARWARRPISLGNPGSTWSPIVVGPRQIPIITSEAVAAAHPEMAVLSAVAHGQSEHAEAVGRAAIEATRYLDNERGTLYGNIVLMALHEGARKILEAAMLQPYEYKSDFVRKYYGQGKTEGKEEGHEEGREEEGRLILHRQLHRRFGPLPAWVAPRLEAAELAQLEAWADAIFDATSLEDLLGAAG